MSGPPPTSHYSNADLKTSKIYDVSKIKAVVTGGGTGIGLMCAQTLQANGATVYITGRRSEVLDSVVKQYSDGPGKLIALPGDVSKKEECLRLARELGSKEPNGIHLLVNNAGIARDQATQFSKNPPDDFASPEAISEHMLESNPDQWANTFETNVTGQFFIAAALVPLLAKANHSLEPYPGIKYTSSIINITSISGLMKGTSSGQFAYAASKAAMVHVSRMLAAHLKETKIRVNQIAPGVFPSEMTTGDSDETQKSELSTKLGNTAKRGGSDAEMAASLLMLAGPGGLFYNGQVLHPDGGQLVVTPAVL